MSITKSRIGKAREIRDAKISFVSLVDKAANKKQFLITKAEDGEADFTMTGRIVKTDGESHYVTGVVYEPMVEDAHGDFMTAEEIAKAAHWFAKHGNSVDLQHSFQPLDGAAVVESWITKTDSEIGDETIRKGTWMMTVEVTDSATWEKIEKGEITGFSMGGHGIYSDEDVDLNTLEKGAVKDSYDKMSKGSLFWNAFDALTGQLKHYDWSKDEAVFETDERAIREALSEFNTIITDILTGDSITKELASAAPTVEKAGKKMSGKNRETLTGIYESLGAFLTEFEDPEPQDTPNTKAEEETNVTKQEVEQIVADAIAKALGDQQQTPAEPNVEKSTEVTPEFITAAVEAAVAKATAPEPMTAETVQQMIETAVNKALEPIRKRTGVPSNLNDSSGTIEKQAEEHYLHGIL